MTDRASAHSGLGDLLHSGDSEDWKRLLDEIPSAPMLVRISHRMGTALRGQATPEDIWQDTLLCAWRDRKTCQWRGLREFRNWLMEIAENRIHDAVERLQTQKRDAGRERSLSRPGDTGNKLESTFEPRSPSKSPSSAAAQAELAVLMREALDGLPPIYREVLRLRLFEEWERERIATHLGLSLAAVKHRIRLGAKLYRDRLAFARSTRSREKGEAENP
jgi:RNA polymerase sigma-70 factor (ECF subfamily)